MKIKRPCSQRFFHGKELHKDIENLNKFQELITNQKSEGEQIILFDEIIK